ncbi:ectonucleotide pyrophosphatase/phosphodiesterase [Sporosarcina sp. YIM B06819]|uniref:alkaline phosphatase family protein n=1 Tax=Sporosarcina sp. YIM B06819 TaxID=3081769 RepID=UPI00298CD6A0|nr:ectonucleotide pyrophosphatase/phosphodiesterase [Sporosarcina sp. YIM B06819]
MPRLTDHLLVLSFDCLSSLDLPMLETLPHFKELLDKAAICRNVETVYPSVTYPCHASIVTGNLPKRHGVVTNTLLQPNRLSPDWYWHRRHIKGTTLYDEAKKAGMLTAALLWPVTAKARIDYHMPEIFSNRPWHHQIAVSIMNGSKRYQIEMNNKFGHLRNGVAQPELDDFVTASTVHTIKTKRPNLMLVHLVDLDTQRHHHGFSSEEAHAAIHRHDRRLGEILSALKDSGMYEQTTIVALGDHSSLDHSKAVKLNVLLKDSGLIQLNGRGMVKDWRAYCKSNDGSAYIYVKDEQAKDKVRALLHSLAVNENNGIEFVLEGAEAGLRGADEHAAFMVEARRGFYFTEHLDGEPMDIITAEDVVAGKYTHASHGYSPEKQDYSTVFIAKGKGIRPNVEIEHMRLIDEGPTFARLLGLDLGKTDGKLVEGILKSK